MDRLTEIFTKSDRFIDAWTGRSTNRRIGWLRLVGSIKLQVSFAKELYKRDDILHKRSII